MLDSWALIRFILCFFTPHPNEIQRADQVAQVNFIPIVELDGSAKKSDSPKIAGVSHEPSSAVREMKVYRTTALGRKGGIRQDITVGMC
jgi:hypothetical protein